MIRCPRRLKKKSLGWVRDTVSSPGSNRRSLCVTILAGRDLPKMDFRGHNDTYVKVTIGENTLKTSTINNGGPNPVWNEGNGEMLEFSPIIVERIPIINIACWDDDIGATDDLIGSTSLNMDASPIDEKWNDSVWIALRRKGKMPKGQLHVKIEYNPSPEVDKKLSIAGGDARDVKSMFGKNIWCDKCQRYHSQDEYAKLHPKKSSSGRWVQ